MGAFLSTSGRVRQKRGEGLQISRQSRRRAGYVVASRSVGRFCCRRVSRENDRVDLGRRQGKDRQKVKERNAGVWQVGWAGRTEFCLSTGRTALDRKRFGPVHSCDRGQVKDKDDKGERDRLCRVDRRQTRSKEDAVGGKSGHISKALLPQPQAKAKAGPLKGVLRSTSASAGAGAGAVAVAVAVPVGSAWQGQGQPRPTG